MREIINGIFYVMRSGCPWRLLPSDLPPWSTIYRWFAKFRDEDRFAKINHALVMFDRERTGRQSSPTGAIIDSQSVKTTEAGGPRGYDAGKKINGRKRHALVDTDGRGLVLEPHPASVQDRDGGGPLLRISRRIFPFIQRVFADGGYAGEKVANATSIAVEIVRKNPDQIGFAVQPRRWVVERFFAWIGRNRRLAKDFEATIDSARAGLYAAFVIDVPIVAVAPGIPGVRILARPSSAPLECPPAARRRETAPPRKAPGYCRCIQRAANTSTIL